MSSTLSFPAIPALLDQMAASTPPSSSTPGNAPSPLSLVRGTLIAVNNTPQYRPINSLPLPISNVQLVGGPPSFSINITTSSSHGFQVDDWIQIVGVNGSISPSINNKLFAVSTVISPVEIQIDLLTTTPGWTGAWTSGGVLNPIQMSPYTAHVNIKGTDLFSVPWIGPPPSPPGPAGYNPTYAIGEPSSAWALPTVGDYAAQFVSNGYIGQPSQVWCLSQPPSTLILGTVGQMAVNSSWQELPLLLPWDNFGNPFYPAEYQIIGNRVTLRGLINNPVSNGSTMSIATLGFPPQGEQMFNQVGSIGSLGQGSYRVDIGGVGIGGVGFSLEMIGVPSGVVNYLSLDGISWTTGD